MGNHFGHAGIHPGHIKEGRGGNFTSQGKAEQARRLQSLYPQGYPIICDMASLAKGNRENPNLNPVTRKLGQTPGDRQAKEMLRGQCNVRVIEEQLDVAIHFVNSETNTVYVATSKPLIVQKLKQP